MMLSKIQDRDLFTLVTAVSICLLFIIIGVFTEGKALDLGTRILWLILTCGLGLALGSYFVWTALKGEASKYGFWGAYHTFQGRSENAEDSYQRVLKCDPDHYESLYYLGVAYAGRRDFDRAISFYERCLRLRPNDPNVLFKLGAVYYDVNNRKRAVRLWEKFIEYSRNQANHSMVQSLLEKVAEGEKDILSKQDWLDHFRWEDEGWTAGRRTSLFVGGCAVEFGLLFIYIVAKVSGNW